MNSALRTALSMCRGETGAWCVCIRLASAGAYKLTPVPTRAAHGRDVQNRAWTRYSCTRRRLACPLRTILLKVCSRVPRQQRQEPILWTFPEIPSAVHDRILYVARIKSLRHALACRRCVPQWLPRGEPSIAVDDLVKRRGWSRGLNLHKLAQYRKSVSIEL